MQGYLAGLALELDLHPRFSIEANGLYRPLHASQRDESVLIWQFPVLGKLRMRPLSRVQPVFEAGPSFRLSGNRNGYHPSPLGLTTGAGAEIQLCGIRIGPVLPYTRWARDATLPKTRPEQVELLVGLSF